MKTPTRQSGILLHPTSLDGPEGVGTLGDESLGFVDFLARAGQKWWQLLPLGPPGYGDSPYAGFSSVAGNPLLISLEGLRREGWLERAEVAAAAAAPLARGAWGRRIDYRAVERLKGPLWHRAAARFLAANAGPSAADYTRFCEAEAGWLDDYALFMAIKDAQGLRPWWRWPRGLRLRQPAALQRARRDLADAIEHQRVGQFWFARQWARVRAAATARGIRLVGDMPIYVARDSVDVWAEPEGFLLDARRRPVRVAGVPPDYFSRNGQLWGNPVYDWDFLRRTRFAWWERRLRANYAQYDIVRFDHFRALAAYWGVPFGHRTARRGRWYPAPGRALLGRMQRVFGHLNMIVEDLGHITPDVHRLREAFDLPGMKILHYAFGGDGTNTYLPHHYAANMAVYTGTHDNDTTRGWFRTASAEVRAQARALAGPDLGTSAWPLVRLAWGSPARIALAPMQDLLDLDSRARMNVPGTTDGNWQWRLAPGALTPALATRLRTLTEICGR